MTRFLVKDLVKTNVSCYNKSDNWEYINYLYTGNLTNNVISEVVKLIPGEDTIPSRAKRKVKQGDILYSTVRPNQCHFGYMKNLLDNMLVSTGYAVLEPLADKVCGKYLYYYLTQREIVEYLHSIAEGTVSTYPSIQPKDIEKISIDMPDLDEQKAIASVLSAYDDLIEKNNRKIEILQDMAEELYKEWFVRFRFPGYKTAKFTDGIPDGWEYKPFSKIATFERGVSYSSDEIDCEDGINLINLKNINSYGGFRLDGTKKYNGKYRDGQVVKCGDLVMGVTDMTQDRRTVGAVALIPHFDNTCVISADLVKLNSDIDNLFIYSLCRYGYYSKFFSQFANGSNVLHLKPSSLRNQKMLIPREDLIDSYVKVVRQINDTVNNLNRENDNLKQQRDLLLPRLMSGKLEVKVS